MAALVGTVMGLVWLPPELPSVVGETGVAVGGILVPVPDEEKVDEREDVPWVMENSGD